MSTKKKHIAKAKTNAPRRRRPANGHTVPAGRAVPFSDDPFERELHGLLDEFGPWLDQELTTPGEDGQAIAVADVAGARERLIADAAADLWAMREAEPEFTITEWEYTDLQNMLLSLPYGDGPDEDVVDDALIPMGLFLQFLGDRGHWTGSEESFLLCLEAITDVLDPDAEMLDPDSLEVPDVDPHEEVGALTTLPVSRQLDALVTWVGDGRELTPDGSLTQSDLLSATAMLSPVGGRNLAPLARSVAEVSELDLLWAAAVDNGLISDDDGVARQGPSCARWLDSGDDGRLGLVRRTLGSVVAEALSVPSDEDGAAAEALEIAAGIVAGAFTDLPTPVDFVDPEGLDLLDADEREEFEDTVLIVREAMDYLQEAGLVEVGESYTVPDLLKPAVREGLCILIGEGEDLHLTAQPV